MNGEMFDLYVETQLVPTLREGDVVIRAGLIPSYEDTENARREERPAKLGVRLAL